jgi:BolA protein
VSTDRISAIRSALQDRFDPEYLDVVDESHLHDGHAGARSGKGHFRVVIISEAFAGMTRLRRHQAVFDALGNLMDTDIHALSIQPATPDEV